ncbi:MAG: hypothetical protein OCU17_06480 [Methanophagales archaeon]|nr:hypothetical protein [Methanophagales archaeon]
MYSLLQNFIYYPISFCPMRGERISIRNFEEVRSQLVREKDPVVKQKLSFLVVADEDCLYFERAVEASCIDITTGYKWIRNKDVE